jgi:AcrR family transcriptional regulator
MNDDSISLREQKKLEARNKTLEVAQRLFHEKGFDDTTIEEICAESMISKRTFFRYFRDKESLLFPNREERLETFKMFLATNDEADNPFDVLRVATEVFSDNYAEAAPKILAQQEIIQSSPALRAREREIDRDWEREIAAAFSRRSKETRQNELWSAVVAGAVMGVVRATMRQWYAHGATEDLGELGQAAIDCLERGFPEKL